MNIEILDYAEHHQQAFRDLNLAWIQRYFVVEAKDRATLDDPRGHILAPGGHILMAEADGRTVGCCALIPMKDGGLELAKMAVSPSVHGQGIGWILGQAVVQRAREAHAARLFLDSNRILEPAIALYRKLGFTELPFQASPYARSDIQMELSLK